MHTTVSDGTDSPEEIIEKVQQAGIEMFAVTDHDAIEGAIRVEQCLKEQQSDLLFLKGIEFSCRDSRGKYHILGYRYRTEAEEIRTLVEEAHQIRLQKVHARLDFLKEEFGFEFEEEDIQSLFRNSNPGKPHIAKMMIRYGYATSILDAMKNYLNKKKFPNQYITPDRAIEAILKSGGIPVLAHPSYGDGGQMIIGEEMDLRLRHLLKYGIAGVECYYSGFTPKLQREMLAFADKYDLYVTAGSDYHGSNKLVRLGENNLDRVSEGSDRVRAFLQCVLS